MQEPKNIHVKINLNTKLFLKILEGLDREKWSVAIEARCIHLRRTGSETIFSTLTAVYFELTQKEIHRGSFFVEELTKEYNFPWWEILEISYANIACNCGNRYNHHLRRDILVALSFPLKEAEKL